MKNTPNSKRANGRVVTAALIAGFVLALLSAGFVLGACDMTFINPLSGSGGDGRGGSTDDDSDRAALEKDGHFLKIINLPYDTQVTNISAVSAANAVNAIAQRADNAELKIFHDLTNATAYVPLAYSGGGDFIENGTLYVSFTVDVDALIRIVVRIDDRVLVKFTDGRGEIDIKQLPAHLLPDDPLSAEQERVEREEHYLKLINLPRNTSVKNIGAATVLNAAGAAGHASGDEPVKIFKNTLNATAYIPLVYPDNSPFLEDGQFYVAFAVEVDALTRIIVQTKDNILVAFAEGRGELDVLSLPPGLISGGDPFSPNTPPYINEEEQDLIEREGHYLKILHLPYNTQTTSFTDVHIDNAAATVAKCPDLAAVKLFRDTASVTAYVPLAYNSGGSFLETGPFYAAVSANIDALTWIAVTRDSLVLVDFLDGRGTLDVLSLRPGETISPDWPITEDEQQQELERSGRYLKLLNMPFNTLAANIKSCAVADSHNDVARLDTVAGAAVFKQTVTATVYINLANTDGSEFLVNGPFFITLSVFIDANTWIEIPRSAAVMVDFVNGQGTLDVLTLRPGDTISPEWPVTEPEPGEDIAEMERNGHYLRLYHIPSGTRPEFVSGLSVSDGSSAVAAADQHTSAIVVQDGSFSNAYLPLVSSNGGSFTRTGAFFVAFSIRVDALTAIAVSLQDNVIVNFDNGRGELDIEHLIREHPDVITQIPDPVVEEEIDNIINIGGYVRFHNLPYNTSKYSFALVSVDDDLSTVAKPADYDAVAVRKSGLTAEAFVPINFIRNGLPFSETGPFVVSFTINISVGCRIVVLPSYLPRPLYQFQDGAASINVSLLSQPPVQPPIITHCLTISGLPPNTSPAVFTNVFVHNAAGVTAKCPDYNRIYTAPIGNASYAVIPLVYENNQAYNDKDFAETGSFIVTFAAYPDADHVIYAALENNCRASFSNGSALLNAANIPAVPRRTLSITGLPSNTQATNVSDVFVYNQAGEIALCPDYGLVEAVSASGSVTLRVPLVYSDGQSKDLMFIESGPFYVSFDVNPDALTRFLLAETDRVSVNFSNGNGSFNIANIPQPPPIPYLTITGLPVNTTAANFSDIFVWNQAGKVARCADYQAILISRNATSASAMIPLAYNSNPQLYFRDNGSFIVSFTAYIDINYSIVKEQADAMVVSFTNGSGALNIAGDRGFASVSLTNPNDLAPPVIKAGSVFEMNDSYERVTVDTGVQATTFSATGVVYVYAQKYMGYLSFAYSTTAPTWNASKNGYYYDNNRALFKLLFIKDSSDKYAAKTFISNSFTLFSHYTLDNATNTTNGRSAVYSLNGASNPLPFTYSVATGWYLFKLTGAGGGGGGGIDGYGNADYKGGNGGSGGSVAELVYLNASDIKLFAGSGGEGTGSFPNGTSTSTYETSKGSSYSTTTTGTISGTHSQGAGAGGGGAGAFVYHQNGYFLCAGGGAGGNGAYVTANSPNGVGGAGGSVGSGAGGGGGKSYGTYSSYSGMDPNDDRETVTTTTSSSYSGSPGGNGGGNNGGSRGGSNGGTGSNGADQLGRANAFTTSAYNGGTAPYTNYSAADPNAWINTNNANGQSQNNVTNNTASGSHDGLNGGNGGNNRNSSKGGGATGGSGGSPSSNSADYVGKPGNPGSVTIYHIGG